MDLGLAVCEDSLDRGWVGGAGIGYYGCDGIKAAEVYQAGSSEFCVIGDDVHLAGSLDHAFFGLDNEGIAVVEAVFSYSGSSNEGLLGADVFEHVLRVWAEIDAGSRAQGAANAGQLDGMRVSEKIGDGQGIGDYLDVSALELEGYLVGGGSAIDYDGVAVFDEFCGSFADDSLLLGHGGTPAVEKGQAVSFALEYDTAVRSSEDSLLFERVEVTAGGGDADLELAGNVVEAIETLFGQ